MDIALLYHVARYPCPSSTPSPFTTVFPRGKNMKEWYSNLWQIPFWGTHRLQLFVLLVGCWLMLNLIFALSRLHEVRSGLACNPHNSRAAGWQFVAGFLQFVQWQWHVCLVTPRNCQWPEHFVNHATAVLASIAHTDSLPLPWTLHSHPTGRLLGLLPESCPMSLSRWVEAFPCSRWSRAKASPWPHYIYIYSII